MSGPDQWTQVEGLFHEALGVPEDSREAFLVERCGPDQSTRERVMMLLRARREMGDFLKPMKIKLRSVACGGEPGEQP